MEGFCDVLHSSLLSLKFFQPADIVIGFLAKFSLGREPHPDVIALQCLTPSFFQLSWKSNWTSRECSVLVPPLPHATLVPEARITSLSWAGDCMTTLCWTRWPFGSWAWLTTIKGHCTAVMQAPCFEGKELKPEREDVLPAGG